MIYIDTTLYQTVLATICYFTNTVQQNVMAHTVKHRSILLLEWFRPVTKSGVTGKKVTGWKIQYIT